MFPMRTTSAFAASSAFRLGSISRRVRHPSRLSFAGEIRGNSAFVNVTARERSASNPALPARALSGLRSCSQTSRVVAVSVGRGPALALSRA